MKRIIQILLSCTIILTSRLDAQQIVWNDDGSLEVTGDEAVIYSPVATSFDNSMTMPHLNFGYFFRDLDNRWYQDHLGGSIMETTCTFCSSYMKLEVFTYNPNKSDKLGSFLYGFENNGSYPNSYHEIGYEVDPNKWFSTPLSQTRSTNVKYWASQAKIPVPTECAAGASHNVDLSVINFIGHASLFVGEVGLTYLSAGTYQAIKAGLVGALLETGYISIGGYEGNNRRVCDKYESFIQPVIFKLTIKNAKLKSIKLSGIPGEVKAAELFKTDYPRWQYADFSNLFVPDGKTTIVAHRGYWRRTGVAQNSIAAIDDANLKSDASMIELDVRSTKDTVPICFHDDKPQKILQETATTYPHASVYDLEWAQLKVFALYDRHDNPTTEKLVSLEQAFKHYADNNMTKPINLDIGIPDKVPQNNQNVDGRPFFNAIFLRCVRLAAQYGLTDKIVFKGKYTIDDPIWDKVKNILQEFYVTNPNGFKYNPVIAYTPKFGDDTGLGTPNPDSFRQQYLTDWLNDQKRVNKPFITMVGMEVRLKNDQVNTANTQMLDAITKLKAKRFSQDPTDHLKVGIFSETPSNCQGYWTKSALEKYIDFTVEKRNNFDWILNKGYDYIITDFPNILNQLLQARNPKSN